eukprot:1437739-Pyramimonas_sp.AAC.1
MFALCAASLFADSEMHVDAKGRGATGGCAGDVGAAFKQLMSLLPVERISAVYEKISCLQLKPPKCILVPVGGPFDPDVVQRIQAWLRGHLPQW